MIWAGPPIILRFLRSFSAGIQDSANSGEYSLAVLKTPVVWDLRYSEITAHQQSQLQSEPRTGVGAEFPRACTGLASQQSNSELLLHR